MNTSDIANEIYQELNMPADLMVSSIIYWLNSNVGVLNLLLETNFTVSSIDNSISPAMGETEKSVYKLLYNRYYYNKLLNTTLMTAGYGGAGAIIEVTEGNRTIRMNAGTEIAKSYQSIVIGVNGMLGTLVQAYKMNQNTPLEVVYEEEPSLTDRFAIQYALPTE